MVPPDHFGSSVPRERLLPFDQRRHDAAEKQPYIVFLGIVGIVLVSLNPILARMAHVSGPPFHATIETVGALLGLVAGLAMISQFYALGNRFYLFVGLAFLVNAAEDVAHGLLSFEAAEHVLRVPPSDLAHFIPATYVAGRLLMGLLLLGAPFVAGWLGPAREPRQETLRAAVAVVFFTLLVTCVAYFVSLPQFVYPESRVPRPIDLLSAGVFVAALAAMLYKYGRDGDVLTWWLALSLLINAAGQLAMSFSKSFYDPLFDAAHVEKVLGYAVPLLGFCICQAGVITDLARTATALRASEGRYRQLLDSVDLGVAEIDASHMTLGVNAALARMYLKTPEDLIGEPCYRVFRQRETICTDCPGVAAMATGRPAEAEVRGVRDDGASFWCRLRAIPTFAVDSAIAGFVELVEDITAYKQADEALRTSQAMYRTLFDSSSDAIMLLTPAEGFLSGNPAALAIFGCRDAEEFATRTPADLSPEYQPDGALSAEKAQRMMAIALAEGSHFFEWIHRRTDGVEFPATVLLSRVELDGKVLLQATVRDITAQKRMEDDLRQARDDAEAATRAKSRFLANMSHEIRTPITAILGFADVLIEEHAANSAWREPLAIIKRNGEHLLQIINDILDVSKIEEGQFTVERVACSPGQIAAEIRSLMEGRAAAKGLTFDVEQVGPIPETIHTDPTRLRQILINLVGNAVKFTETGNVRLILRFADGQRPAMEFDVIDTGIGMTAEQAKNVFQPFVQADLSTARRFGGSGLGLAISKRLAPMLGGSVDLVESAPGAGSHFRLTIPMGSAGKGQREQQPAAASVPGDGGLAAQFPAGCRVLLAEDGVDNQRLIARLLTRAGAEVTVVENGQLALDAVAAARGQASPFQVIIMDMQMPLVDGYEATRRLRAAGYSGPILALTAYAMKEDRQKCLDAGCNDYLTKPIDRAALLTAVRAVTDQSVEVRTES